VLSQFTVDDKGAVTLQECACRRQVIAFGSFWWSCKTADQPPPTPNPMPHTDADPDRHSDADPDTYSNADRPR
jgi:hypothetical protein